MASHTLDAAMTPEQILEEVLATEREVRDVLVEAARLTADAEERGLFERLAQREETALRELAEEQERLEAEAFVQRALDC